MTNRDTLIGGILFQSEKFPDKVVATLLLPSEEKIHLTYKDIISDSRRMAGHFALSGIRKGDLVVLAMEHSVELLYAYLGALMNGAIVSVLAPPNTQSLQNSSDLSFENLVKECEAKFVITNLPLGQFQALGKFVRILDTKGYEVQSNAFPISFSKAQDLVVLQHSAGTTGTRKGIRLSNQNILDWIGAFSSALGVTKEDKFVNWIPLYHDLGLLGAWLLPLVTGTPFVLMSPFHLIQNPLLFFRLIHEERGTICFMPNFAYSFLSTHLSDSDCAGLDLSSMRVWINGSEPISLQSLEKFYGKFHSLGVRRNSLSTGYGMAEGVMSITFSPPGRELFIDKIDREIFLSEQRACSILDDSTKSLVMVSCGPVLPGCELKIVDSTGGEVPERAVGEIAFRSPWMFKEYFPKSEESSGCFVNGWFMTGDLGYFASGELFVTGRKKELICIRGRKFSPQEIEEIVTLDSSVRPGRVVAFGVYSQVLGTEELYILAETRDTTQDPKAKLRIARLLKTHLDCAAKEINFLPKGWLVKSSSGKVSRHLNRNRFFQSEELF